MIDTEQGAITSLNGLRASIVGATQALIGGVSGVEGSWDDANYVSFYQAMRELAGETNSVLDSIDAAIGSIAEVEAIAAEKV